MDTLTRPPLSASEDLARIIGHSLLRPELTSAQALEGIQLARRYGVAAVSVRPCDVELAVRHLEGSSVIPASVVGFPHGSQTTPTKLFEVRDLLRRGAREIAVTMAISRLLSREFQHVQTELTQISEACHKERATLTAILENAWLTEELKIIALRCAERAEVDSVSTSTGFGPSGYTVPDLALMRKYLPEETGVEAGGVSTLPQAMEAYEAGATRIATAQSGAILEAWKKRLAAAAATPAAEPVE
jgi:deoxyribose-phosphate aldolase